MSVFFLLPPLWPSDLCPSLSLLTSVKGLILFSLDVACCNFCVFVLCLCLFVPVCVSFALRLCVSACACVHMWTSYTLQSALLQLRQVQHSEQKLLRSRQHDDWRDAGTYQRHGKNPHSLYRCCLWFSLSYSSFSTILCIMLPESSKNYKGFFAKF